MNANNCLFKWLHYRLQSDIFGYYGNGTGNRVHTPLYIGGVPSTHLSPLYHCTHLNTQIYD